MGGLPDDRVARHQRGDDLGDGDGDGEVERRDDGGHAARLQAALHDHAVDVLLVRLALQRQALRGDALDHADGFVQVQLAVEQRLAHLAAHGLLEVFIAGVEDLGQVQEDLGLDVAGDGPPGGEGGLGGAHGLVYLGVGRFGDVARESATCGAGLRLGEERGSWPSRATSPLT